MQRRDVLEALVRGAIDVEVRLHLIVFVVAVGLLLGGVATGFLPSPGTSLGDAAPRSPRF